MKDWLFRIASRGNMRSQETPHLVREILAKLKVQLGEVHGQRRNREKPGEQKEEAELQEQRKKRGELQRSKSAGEEERRRRRPHREREQTLDQEITRSGESEEQSAGERPQCRPSREKVADASTSPWRRTHPSGSGLLMYRDKKFDEPVYYV
jgi:hypothetical protein